MSMSAHTHRRPIVAVIGDASSKSGTRSCEVAECLGRALADSGYRIITGGLGGVMEAAHRGARASDSWRDGACIGVLPGTDPLQANEYVDIVIPTGLGHGRNLVIAHADAVVAVGGGAGTLSELAFAWINRRLIIGMRCGGWSERLADQRIDERIRYRDLPDDRVFGAADPAEATALLAAWLPFYSARPQGLAPSTEIPFAG